MKFSRHRLAGMMLPAAALLFGYSALQAVSPAEPTPYAVREGMVTAINPAITAIWDLQVEVMDDNGDFDPSLMSDENWANLLAASQQLADATAAQANAPSYIAQDPNSTLEPADETTDLAAIQARLDEKPEVYRAMSQAMSGHAAQLVAAVQARDTAKISTLVNDAQPMCKACHDQFWYPEDSEI